MLNELADVSILWQSSRDEKTFTSKRGMIWTVIGGGRLEARPRKDIFLALLVPSVYLNKRMAVLVRLGDGGFMATSRLKLVRSNVLRRCMKIEKG
jgi:hypothetical protein